MDRKHLYLRQFKGVHLYPSGLVLTHLDVFVYLRNIKDLGRYSFSIKKKKDVFILLIMWGKLNLKKTILYKWIFVKYLKNSFTTELVRLLGSVEEKYDNMAINYLKCLCKIKKSLKNN